MFKPSFLLILALLAFSSCATTDIRTGDLKRNGLQPDLEAQGRALLHASAEAHGLDAWQQHTTAEVILRDDWRGLSTRILGRPWDNERMRWTYELGTFNGQAQLLEGKQAGTVWGLQSWQGYRIDPSGETTLTDNIRAEFFIPAIIYLNELPFRLINATTVTYLDQKTLDGQAYDRVFATWGSPKAQRDVDQYIVWIDPQTKLVRAVEFTIRDQFKFVKSSSLYSDYREVDGVMVPFHQLISSRPKAKRFYFHQIVVESAQFDTVPIEAVHPLPGLERIGDDKVVAQASGGAK
ncbi:MAG: hypothetical protein RhofKO_01760 [Rhodothermales bacterium]